MHVRLMALVTFFLSGFLLWAQPQTSPKKEYEVKIIKNQEVQFIDKTTRAVVKTFHVNERKPFRSELSKQELLNRYNFSPGLQSFIRREDINLDQGTMESISFRPNGVIIVYYNYDVFYVDHVLLQLEYIVCFNRAGELIFEGELKPWAAMEIEFSPDHQFFMYETYGTPFYGPGDDVSEAVYLYSIAEKKYVYEYHEEKESSFIHGPVFQKLKNLEISFHFDEDKYDGGTVLVLIDLTKRKWYKFEAPKGAGLSFNKYGEIVLGSVPRWKKIRVLSLDEFEQGEF